MSEQILTDRLRECTWQVQHRQSDISTRGGVAQVLEYGPPFWVLSFRYENLTETSWRLLSAWLGRRYGASVPFFSYRPGRSHPAINRHADNNGVGVDIYDAAAGTIRFTGLTGKTLQVSDMVAYQTASGGYFVGEVIEAVTVGVSSSIVKTSPPVVQPAPSPSPQIAYASGLFRLIPSSVQKSENYQTVNSISFKARQEEP